MLAIQVDNLGKRYRLGLTHSRSIRDLADRVTGRLLRTIRRKRQEELLASRDGGGQGSKKPSHFWALRGVSFDVRPGEVIGIIGRNGAGKSTLLKLLSRITLPTEGQIAIRGRVASLLEVGTGFHPELTGRENVFLNGAILGMTRAEIRRKLDDIVAFSEIEKFIDTPVKRYSSGMFVRLAFAVAAHLEPEILIVDEVLAVGDIGFQRKCLGKMQDVSGGGRTVLFVSHNMAAVAALCSRLIVLDEGRVLFSGETQEGIAEYLRHWLGQSEQAGPIQVNRHRFETSAPQRITDLEILDEAGSQRRTLATGDYACFRIHFALDEPLTNPGFRLRIFSDDRAELFRVSTDPISGYHVPALKPCRGHIDCVVPRFPFTAGTYFVDIGLTRANFRALHDVENAAMVEVQGGSFYNSGVHLTTETCFFVCDHHWRFAPESTVSADEG